MKNRKIRVILGDVIAIGDKEYIIMKSKNQKGQQFYLKKLSKICPKCKKVI